MRMTEVRCPNGHGWFEKGDECPECGYRQKLNVALRAQQLNSHLFEQASRAAAEPK
jgi:hypothetical protein